MEEKRLLSGVRVLDFGRVLAAPHAARHMSDLGAEVIKIERPVYGDDIRMDPFIFDDGLSAGFMQQNWGKLSLSIDLRHPRAREVLGRLVEHSDVVFENFRPGVMALMGLSYDEMRQINPKIIMCSVSAFGQTGPYAQRAGYGPIAEALAAIPELTGERDGPPMPTLVPIADNVASALALAAVCAALFNRERTGEGEYIDVSLLDAAFQMHDMAVQQFLASHGEVRMTRRGLLDETWVPWGFFHRHDGWVAIMAGNESIWRSLARVMGREDMIGDSKYSSYESRYEHREEIYGIVREWVDGFEKLDDVVAVLAENGIPGGPVNDVEAAIADPQIQARGMLKEFDHPVVGRVRVMNSGIHLTNTAADVRGIAPDLGEHNRKILTEIAGFSTEEVAEFYTEGLLYEHPRVTAASVKT